MPTPHRAPHEPNYTLRRDRGRLIRICLTCASAAKARWAKKNREKVANAARKWRLKHKLEECAA